MSTRCNYVLPSIPALPSLPPILGLAVAPLLSALASILSALPVPVCKLD